MSLSRGAVEVIVVSCVFLFLAVIALIFRLLSRQIKRIKLCFNDYAIMLATVLTAAEVSIFLLAAFRAGLGAHIKEVPPNMVKLFFKLFVAGQILWAAANSCVKVSIIDLYIRTFPNPFFRKICYFTIGLVICYFFSVLLEAFLLCRPVAYNWNKTIPGECANANLAYLFAGITNLLIDALVVALPMPMLWRLKLPLSKKIGITGMFSLGVVICVISLQRVLWLKNWDLSDLTYSVAIGSCWSVLEPTLGVVNACLPTMRPILQKLFEPKRLAWSKAYGKHSHGERRWYHYHSGPSQYANNPETKSFQRLNDLRYPLTDLEANQDYPVRTVGSTKPGSKIPGINPSDEVLPGNTIRVTSRWEVERVEANSSSRERL